MSDRGALVAAPVHRRSDGGIEIATPHTLFPLTAREPARLDASAYDVLPDGRFVVNRLLSEAGTSTITVVLNWMTGR